MDNIQALLNSLLALVLSIGITFILFYVKKLVAKYGFKLNADTQAKIQEIVQQSIAQAVSYAEQWAKKMEKETEGKKVSGSEKLVQAVEYAFSDLRNHGVTAYSEKEIRDKIESFLGIGTLNINSLGNVLQEGDHDEPFTTDD